MGVKQEKKYNPLAPNRTILSVRCAAYLVERGHKVLRTRPDRKFPEQDVYIFENTIQLHEDVQRYMDMCERDKQKRGLK